MRQLENRRPKAADPTDLPSSPQDLLKLPTRVTPSKDPARALNELNAESKDQNRAIYLCQVGDNIQKSGVNPAPKLPIILSPADAPKATDNPKTAANPKAPAKDSPSTSPKSLDEPKMAAPREIRGPQLPPRPTLPAGALNMGALPTTASAAALADADHIYNELSGLYYNRSSALDTVLTWVGQGENQPNRLNEIRAAFEQRGYGDFDTFIVARLYNNWNDDSTAVHRWVREVCYRDLRASAHTIGYDFGTAIGVGSAAARCRSSVRAEIASHWARFSVDPSRPASEPNNSRYQDLCRAFGERHSSRGGLSTFLASDENIATSTNFIEGVCYIDPSAAAATIYSSMHWHGSIRQGPTTNTHVALNILRYWGSRGFSRLNEAFNGAHPEIRDYFSHAAYHGGRSAADRPATEQPTGGTLHNFMCFNLRTSCGVGVAPNRSQLGQYIQIYEGEQASTDVMTLLGNSTFTTSSSSFSNYLCNTIAGYNGADGNNAVSRENAARVRNLARIWDSYLVWRHWEYSDNSPLSNWNGTLTQPSHFAHMAQRASGGSTRVQNMLRIAASTPPP